MLVLYWDCYTIINMYLMYLINNMLGIVPVVFVVTTPVSALLIFIMYRISRSKNKYINYFGYFIIAIPGFFCCYFLYTLLPPSPNNGVTSLDPELVSYCISFAFALIMLIYIIIYAKFINKWSKRFFIWLLISFELIVFVWLLIANWVLI